MIEGGGRCEDIELGRYHGGINVTRDVEVLSSARSGSIK